MAIRVKTGASSWANVSKIRVKISNTSAPYWADVIVGRIKDTANTWKNFFLSALTPTIQTKVTVTSSGGTNAGSTIMNDVSAITLTATRYHWLDADGFTYIWQKSSDDSNWENIGTAQSTTNPASGSSSSSITKVLSGSDFTSGSDMYFRFKFMATNSTYNTSASSESLSKLISYYGTPIPQSPYPEITGSTTVGKNAYGSIGVWTNSPTSYAYRWYFMSGATSYPLTFSQSRSVSNKSLSGFTATLTTSAAHGYKVSDIAVVTSVDSLLNKSSATITSVTSNTFSYTITTPTAWSDAGASYTSGTYVSYFGNVYAASSTFSGVSPFNGGTLYSIGAIVYSGNNRYQSKTNNNIGNSVTNTTYWTDLGSYAPGGSFWTLQNFSNTAASGTTTAPNYYEGTSSSSTSFLLTVPETDYRSGLNMIDKALYFAVKAYNPATLSPSEYSNYKMVYGFPVMTLGTPTYPSGTQAQITFSSSYAAKYSIDVTRAGSSHTGYPFIATPATSPINISGLTAGLTYTVNVYPINGEETYGDLKTTTITLPNAPGVPTSLSRTLGNAGSKTFSWAAPTSGGSVVSYQYQLNSLGWTNNGTSTSIALTGLSGTNTFQVRAVGSTLTGSPASTGSFTIPTINTGPSSSSVTSSSATISWTSTNQNSWSLSGVGSHSGTSETSKSVTLSSSTSYTPQLTIASSTSDTATTSGSQFTTPAPSFTVTFNANGGTGTMANQTANTATNLTAFGFTAPSGKGFSGWATSSSGSVVYTDQGSYPFTSSTTLYAIYYTLPTAPSQPSPSASSITQTTATISWAAPANGGSPITKYEGQLGSSGYVNLGNVLTISLSGLQAGTSYTYYVRAVNAIGTSSSGSAAFTTTAAPVVPSVTSIVQKSSSTSPFATFVITCTNSQSVRVNVDRAATGTTAPTTSWTAGTATNLALSSNSVTVTSTATNAPGGGATIWYRIRVIPYTGAGQTGTSGTQVATYWKRHNTNSADVTAPPFGTVD